MSQTDANIRMNANNTNEESLMTMCEFLREGLGVELVSLVLN